MFIPILNQLRTNWLSHHFEHARLTGIGGPGAPHSIRLERIGSTGQFYLIVFICP